MYRQHEPPRPIHEPVDHHGPLQTAEEEVRQWRHYIELLQGKLVPGEEHRRHDLLAASREQAIAAIRADDDWMRMNNLTIVEREHAVEGRVLVAKHECAAAAGKIRELQDRLGRDESKVVGVRRRDKFVGMFSSSSKERRFKLHEEHKRKLLLVRQDIGNVMGERQYQDDLVAGYEHLLSTLRTVLVRNQEEVYDAPPPDYDARPDRPPSRHREERAAPPSHRIPRRTRSQRPDTTYSLIPIDIGDFYDDHGDELGHEAIPIHHAPSAALDEPHGQHASPQHHHSAHAAHYNPELERRPTVRSTARQSRLSWVPSSPISSDGLLSPVERNVPFPWDDIEDEPTRPGPSASPYHPGSRSTSPHGAQHPPTPHPHPHQGHAVHSTRPTRRPAPGDLRLVTSVGGGRPLATHRESHESLHATNAAHNFDRLPDVSAIRLDAMSPETAHPER